MPIQIKRHLIILVVMVALFIVFRSLMVPDTFGDLGHYRAASLKDNEAKEIVYDGDESCQLCHEEQATLLEMDLHNNLSCESCHGPGYAHTMNPDSVDLLLPESRDLCVVCHAQNAARDPDMVAQIDPEEHNPETNCNYCHNPHAPWELRIE